MEYSKVFQIVKDLEFDKDAPICVDQIKVRLFIRRPSKLSERFKNYDVKKNFQIWLSERDRTFRPNHLRIMIDLNLRIRSRPDLKKELLTAFDNIYYRRDPDQEVRLLEKEKFDHHLNSLKIIANLAQLFLIEQDYAYIKPSNFNPPTLFFQGWIRQVIDSPKEIDNLCMSIASGQPPASKYTDKENRKNRNYQMDLKPLWYLTEKRDDSFPRRTSRVL